MQPVTVVLLMCGASLASGELHHKCLTEVQVEAIAKLGSCRLLADLSDFRVLLEFLTQLFAFLVLHTLYLYHGDVCYW